MRLPSVMVEVQGKRRLSLFDLIAQDDKPSDNDGSVGRGYFANVVSLLVREESRWR